MEHRARQLVWFLSLFGVSLSLAIQAAEHPSVPINRSLEVIKPGKGSQGIRQQFEQAGLMLGEWTIVIAGIEINGPPLSANDSGTLA